jgi:hypothetical protein
VTANKRQHLRTRVTVKFKLFHPALGERTVTTRDVSDGGVFLILDDPGVLPVGAKITGQVQGLMEDAPMVDMEVVRFEAAGLGLRFVNP